MSLNEHPDYDDLDPDDPRRDWGDDYWSPIERAKADRKKAEEREMIIDETTKPSEQQFIINGSSSEMKDASHGGSLPEEMKKSLDKWLKEREKPKPPLSLPRTVWHRPNKTVYRTPKPPTR